MRKRPRQVKRSHLVEKRLDGGFREEAAAAPVSPYVSAAEWQQRCSMQPSVRCYAGEVLLRTLLAASKRCCHSAALRLAAFG
jgi:hypothetical protein